MNQNQSNNIVVGIVGGMGARSGVYLQQLIVDYTPAESDADQLEVICHTNSRIPDRTESLLRDGGSSYAAEVIRSVRMLENAGATHIIVACNTAHARLKDIQASTKVPVFDFVSHTLKVLRAQGFERVGLLATSGTVGNEVYERRTSDLALIVPTPENQERVMELIYEVKKNKFNFRALEEQVRMLEERGAETVILGCTELSLLAHFGGGIFGTVDPLKLLAREIMSWKSTVDALVR